MPTYKNFTDAFNAQKERIEKFLGVLDTTDGESIMKVLAVSARDQLYKRVKAGYGVSNIFGYSDLPPKKVKLKPLSKKYIKQREKITLGAFASPGISNLTKTGKMLDSIQSDAKKSKIILTIPDTPRSDSTLTNSELAEELQVGYRGRPARPFFAVTDKEHFQIVKKCINLIRQLSKKYFS